MSQSESDLDACSQCGSLALARLDVPPPPYPEPFFSNIEPLESEIPTFRGALEDMERKIGAIDEEIERLRTRRTKFVEFATVQKAVFSPLRRLPSEILSEIFLWCLEDETWLPHIWRVQPWSISKVCRRWRETALSTPSLW
ncbi:hypothetical protein B0H17DRAFT_1000412, partial [Mycena rosella]